MTNQTNQVTTTKEELMEMNKTQLRSTLSRKYNVTLTAQNFKATSKKELVNMALQEQDKLAKQSEPVSSTIKTTKGDDKMKKQSTNNNTTIKSEEMTNMTNNNTALVNVSKIEELANLIKGGNNEVVAQTTKAIKTESQSVLIPAIKASSNQTLIALQKELDEIKTKLNNLNQSTTAKSTLANTAIEKCSVCGFGIRSAEVIRYSKDNYGKAVCFKCQKDGKAKKTNKQYNKPSSTTKSTQAPKSSGKIKALCTACNKPMFLTPDAIQKAKGSAVAKGLPAGVYHKTCGEKALAQLNNTTQQPHTTSAPVMPKYAPVIEVPEDVDVNSSQVSFSTNNNVMFNPTESDIKESAKNNTAAF